MASEGTTVSSEARASSSSDWRAWNEGQTSAKSLTDAVRRVSPDVARATVQEKARKVEKAGSDVRELKKVQNAVSVPTVDVQIQQCESFIMRSERLLAEIDSQRVAEQVVHRSQGQVGGGRWFRGLTQAKQMQQFGTVIVMSWTRF